MSDGSNGGIATDSYRRYKEDVALISEAGLNAYRFSIAWPRVAPGGGAVNPAGIDFYSRLVDALPERGVAPYATLFHWDLPLELQERGGWRARDTSARFADYAGAIGEALGDRVRHFIILNEAAVHAVLGHVLGVHAPGLEDAASLGPVIHHQNLAQGLAIDALRAARRDLSIGTTLALMPARPAGGLMAPLHARAAHGFDELWNGAFLDPLFHGVYPKTALASVGDALKEGDLDITRRALDFVGVNYYAPAYLKFDAGAPSLVAPAAPPRGAPLDAFGRHVDPSGLYEMLIRLRDDYGAPRVIISENGCSDPLSDKPAILDDAFRIDFLRDHLAAVKAAMEAGVDIFGYFHWTLIDNWEWAEGYRSKFGLVAQDRATGARTPKASYEWFRALAATGVLD